LNSAKSNPIRRSLQKNFPTWFENPILISFNIFQMVRSERPTSGVPKAPGAPRVFHQMGCIFQCSSTLCNQICGKTWEDPLLNLESYFSQSPSSSRVRVSLNKTGVASDWP
jgi:hypothetical protein